MCGSACCLGSKTTPLEVEPSDTVESFRIKIQDKEGTPPDQQRVVFGERVLEDGHTLGNYDLQHDSTLYMAVLPPPAAVEALRTLLYGRLGDEHFYDFGVQELRALVEAGLTTEEALCRVTEEDLACEISLGQAVSVKCCFPSPPGSRSRRSGGRSSRTAAPPLGAGGTGGTATAPAAAAAPAGSMGGKGSCKDNDQAAVSPSLGRRAIDFLLGGGTKPKTKDNARRRRDDQQSDQQLNQRLLDNDEADLS